MCDCCRVAFLRQLRKPSGLQAAFGTDAQRVGLAAKHVACDQVANDAVEEVLLGVDQYVLDGAERQRALLERFRSRVIDAAGIDTCRDDVATVVFFQPGDTKRRVESA